MPRKKDDTLVIAPPPISDRQTLIDQIDFLRTRLKEVQEENNKNAETYRRFILLIASAFVSILTILLKK